MKIAIIGPGSMVLLYAGYLSKQNEVFVLGRNASSIIRNFTSATGLC